MSLNKIHTLENLPIVFSLLFSYATSYALEKSSENSFETLYEAGRRGRSGEICQQIYADCKEL